MRRLLTRQGETVVDHQPVYVPLELILIMFQCLGGRGQRTTYRHDKSLRDRTVRFWETLGEHLMNYFKSRPYDH